MNPQADVMLERQTLRPAGTRPVAPAARTNGAAGARLRTVRGQTAGCAHPSDSGLLRVLMANAMQSLGGAGRVGELLAEALRRDGQTVWGYGLIDQSRDPRNRRAGHWREGRPTRWLRRHGLTDLGHLSSLLWRCRPEYAAADVLHLHNIHGDYVSLLALPLWGLDKPVVWTLHDFWALTGNCATPRGCTRWRRACGRCPLVGVNPMGPVDRTRFYRWLKPRLFRALRPRLVTPSRWLARQVRVLPALRNLPLRVIRNPIDCETFSPRAEKAALRRRFGLSPRRPTVVMSGHGWDQLFKGGDQAVSALRRARERLPELQLLVVGTRADALLSATGLSGRIVPPFQDRRSLAEAYACADLCLFPSQAENYPNTVLESLACATPVVAYDVGGIPEQIAHLRSGFVARDGRPDELAAGIVRLVTNAEAARRMGRQGRAFVVRTSAVPIVAAQYRDEYRRAIRAWGRSRGRVSARMRRGFWARRVARLLSWETGPEQESL